MKTLSPYPVAFMPQNDVEVCSSQETPQEPQMGLFYILLHEPGQGILNRIKRYLMGFFFERGSSWSHKGLSGTVNK